MENYNTQTNSAGWLLFVKLSFVISLVAMLAAIIFMPGDLMLKGYMGINALFIVSSTIMVSKTLRDESAKLRRIKSLTNIANKASPIRLFKEGEIHENHD